MRLPTIHSKDELIALVDELGFLPAFANHIPGFSVEECIHPAYWFPREGEGFWEWKGPVIQASGCAYGKFLKGRACFLRPDWYLEFANFRRDGYDFDARYEDGLARAVDKQVFDALWARPSQLSRELRAAAPVKNFDAVITRLQMQGYVVISNFEYLLSKDGRPYGWGLARYETPEHRFGEDFAARVYRHTPAQSAAWLTEHLARLLPDMGTAEITKLIGA